MNFIQVNYDLQKFGYMVERKPLTARETDERGQDDFYSTDPSERFSMNGWYNLNRIIHLYIFI